MLRLLAATLLMTPLLAGPPATAEPAPPAPSAREARALDVLERALGVLGGTSGPGGEATQVLTQLQHSLGALGGEDRDQAEALLARPDRVETDDVDTVYGAQWTSQERQVDRVRCSNPATGKTTPFCVHWIPASSRYASRHEVTATQLQSVFNVMLRTWQVELTELGFRRPVPDGTRGNPAGSTRSGLVDVYLADIGDFGVFGYAMPETNAQASFGYLVLENDFTEFDASKTPHQYRAATAAHEFFHLVQFAYDSWEREGDEAWLMESTATWMEEQVYDSVNDNRAYLPYGSLAKPYLPLDTFFRPSSTDPTPAYATWVFHELYAAAHPEIVRRTWYNAASKVGYNTRAALEKALEDSGTSFYAELRRFGGGSNAPAELWAEGAAYPTAAATSRTVGATYDSGLRTTQRSHLAGVNLAFVPGASVSEEGATITLTAQVDQLRAGTAYALVFLTNGSVQKHPFALDTVIEETKVLSFTRGEVTKVVLNLTNASWTVDNVPVRYRAKVA